MVRGNTTDMISTAVTLDFSRKGKGYKMTKRFFAIVKLTFLERLDQNKIFPFNFQPNRETLDTRKNDEDAMTYVRTGSTTGQCLLLFTRQIARGGSA